MSVAAAAPLFEARPLPVPPSLLGESPFWHPGEAALYWCDIPGRVLNRFHPASASHAQWAFDCEPCSAAPLLGGQLLLAMRDGLWRFDPATGDRHALAPPPYEPARERFNDGKADPQGRFWGLSLLAEMRAETAARAAAKRPPAPATPTRRPRPAPPSRSPRPQ